MLIVTSSKFYSSKVIKWSAKNVTFGPKSSLTPQAKRNLPPWHLQINGRMAPEIVLVVFHCFVDLIPESGGRKLNENKALTKHRFVRVI
jgi:hypothetical protein